MQLQFDVWDFRSLFFKFLSLNFTVFVLELQVLVSKLHSLYPWTFSSSLSPQQKHSTDQRIFQKARLYDAQSVKTTLTWTLRCWFDFLSRSRVEMCFTSTGFFPTEDDFVSPFVVPVTIFQPSSAKEHTHPQLLKWSVFHICQG